MANLWAGKINWILHCDWLPKQARWHYFACSVLPAVSPKENFPKSHIIYVNHSLTKLVQSRMPRYWPNSFFCEFMDLYSVSVHKQAKRELGHYPAILTEQAWSITHTSIIRVFHYSSHLDFLNIFQQNQTESTSPTTKSTCSGLFHTTFFPRW